MDRLISEQAVIESIEFFQMNPQHFSFVNLIDDIKEIPSAEPKTGEWMAQDIHNCHTDFKCSECGYIHNFMHLFGKPTADYTYCPYCGCRMG